MLSPPGHLPEIRQASPSSWPCRPATAARSSATGDVVVFRGDQRHGYHNPGRDEAIAYSVIAFAPITS